MNISDDKVTKNNDRKPLPPQPWNEMDAAFKERMVEEGNWPAFLLERATYRFRGLGFHWANRLAQQHFPPPGFPVKAIRTGISTGACGLGTYGITEIKMRERVIEQLGIAGSARPVEFDDKTCPFNAAMDWVAENLAIQVVKQHAPSALAWSIYHWASLNPGNTSKFYDLYLSRRYKPDRGDELDFDPVEGLSLDGEDVGLPVQSGVPDALAGDSGRCVDEKSHGDCLPSPAG